MPLIQSQGLERYRVAVKTVTGTDQAANTEISDTVPSGQIWELLCVNFNLVTDANAANRQVVLTIDDGTTVICKAASQATQAASLTYNYTFAVGGPERSAVDATTTMRCQLPGPLWIPGGYRIKTVTTNRQVGDNFGAPLYHIVRFSA